MSILNLDTLLENQLEAAGELNPKAPHTRLHFPSGQTVVIPTSILLSDGTTHQVPTTENNEPIPSPTVESGVIPLVEEQLEVSKRVVEKERVRLTRGVEEFMQHVSVPLTEVHWQVEHVPVGRIVAEAPEPRQAGDTMIFPLVEERLVLQRELFLTEEVHVRKVTSTTEKVADVMLKRDVLIEEHTNLIQE